MVVILVAVLVTRVTSVGVMVPVIPLATIIMSCHMCMAGQMSYRCWGVCVSVSVTFPSR